MVMRVASLLGKSVRDVERMDAVEFQSWEDFYEIEPWGTPVLDLLGARLCQVIAAVVGEQRTLDSFLLFGGEERTKEPMTFEEISGVMRQVSGWMKHGDNRRKT